MIIRRLAVLVISSSIAVACLADGERVAVVVSPKNPATNISMSALRELFACERTSWQTGQKVALFSRSSGTPEHNVMIRSILRMTESDYKQFGVMKEMRGESSCRVTELPSKGMSIVATQVSAGAVVLVRQSDVTSEMKVLKVNGKSITDSDYPLR